MDGHFPHERETGKAERAVSCGCRSRRLDRVSSEVQVICRALDTDALQFRSVDFTSSGLILDQCSGGAAMAERSNWTTP